jgi:ABC-type transport system involved in multi-copper enzyme maturation permease subunit
LSVYKHEYRAYTGPLTPLWSRVRVVARYAFAEAWSSRVTAVLFVLSMAPVIVFLVGIYLANNPLAKMLIMKGNQALAINAGFFLNLLEIQCWLALVITAWIAPRLVSFDLADNALPILLSHPISRFGYVLGKFITLFASLSLVTWIPCYSSPEPWVAANLRIAGGMLAGSLLWIGLLSILGLALSSWVKWRVAATGIIFAVVFIPSGIGGIVMVILRTKWGLLLNIPAMMTQLWQQLLGAPVTMRVDMQLPVASIAVALLLVCGGCMLMLNSRIRAREVVRG